MDEANPEQGLWLVSTRRLLIFNGSSWLEQSFDIESKDTELEYLSLHFNSPTDKLPSDPLVALIDSGKLATLLLQDNQKSAEAAP